MERTFIKKSIFTLLAAVLCVANSFGQTIKTDAVDPVEVCAGGTVSVKFTAKDILLAPTNYTAQLSDASGSFAAPTDLGSSATSPISVTIPNGTASGDGYKIRVIGFVLLVPAIATSESASIKINAIPAKPTVTSPVAYEVGDKAVALEATGTGLQWYDTATSAAGSATIPVPDTKTEGTQNFFVSQTVSGCESDRSQIVVNVTKTACTPPAKPVVTTPVSYTKGQAPAALEATALTGAKLNWYGTNATGGTASATAPTPSTGAVGTTTYYVSQTLNDCESERSAIVVNVTACTPPAKPAVTTPVSYIKDQAATTLKATALTGATLNWYGTNATGGTASATAPTPPTGTVGTTTYYVSQTLNDCESERVEIVVNITACTPPAKPAVTTPVSYIKDQAASALSATALTGAKLNWYGTNATGGTASATAPTPSTGAVGTTTYYVSQTLNDCESERSAIVVNVSACTPPAKPEVTTPVSYTKGQAAVALSATALTGAKLNWYGTNATGGTASATAPTPSTNAVGTTTYYVSQTLNDCESVRSEIVVTITACTPPAKPAVTSPVSYTVDDAAVALKATALNGATLNWYGTNATGGTASATAPIPSTKTAATTTYYVSQTINDCESVRSEIIVTVTTCVTPPKPTVSAIDPVCMNATVPSSLLSSAVTQKTGLKWYETATGGPSSVTVPTPTTSTAGIKTYYVTQTVKTCESERVAVSFEVRALPNKPTVETVEYCKEVTTAVALTATGTGVIKWYAAETGGNPLAAAPKPSTATVGTVSYFVSQTVASAGLSCESPRAELKVVTNALPTALPTVSVAFCQERSDKNYTLEPQPSNGNTVNWYTALTGGTASKTAPSVNLKNARETTFYATQVSAKGCESPSPRVAQKIRVKPLPGLPGIDKPLVEICQFVAAQPLSATPVTGGILKWYGTNASGGDPSDNAPVPSTAEGGTTSYFVGQALEGCFGDRAKIDVKINTTPKPQTTTALAYCQNEAAPRLDATGTVLKWYRNATDTEFQGIPFTPFTEKVQDYSFYVSQTGTNGCESPKEEIKIHIKALPSATISGNSTIDLGETATIRIKFTGDGPWIYTLSEGITDTTDQINHEIVVKPSTTTSYLITDVSNSCGKGTPIGSALVTVKIPTINSGNPSVAEACAGKTFNVPFQQSGDFPAENTFKVQIATQNEDAQFKTIPSVRSGNIITATFPDTTLAGSYYVRVVNSGVNPDFTVKGSVSSITITASPLPVATITGTQTILIGDKADMKIETTGKAPWTFTLSNGTKDSVITASVTPYTFKLAPRATTTYTISKVTNGCGTGKGAGSARVQVDPILGVEPPASADWVKVYPTLVTSQCTVELTGTIAPKEASAELIDLTGRSRIVKPISQKTTEVDLSSYPSGLYLLRVTNGNKNTVWRIVKP